jgi:deoxyadenosine/deoxycytidine kinase
VDTAFERIQTRAREGEATISKEYLQALDRQHRAWLANTTGPKLEISTETGTDLEGTLTALQIFFAAT